MTAWSVGYALSPYMPDPDHVHHYRTWERGREALESELRFFADGDDESWWEHLDWLRSERPDEVTDDDAPRTLAQVEAILRDDGPANGESWGCLLETNDGNVWTFWLDAIPDEEAEFEDEDEEDEEC